MVVLEAAAITAGGVAEFKGGKAASIATAKNIKGKLKMKEHEKNRNETIVDRKTERKERFAQINEYRNSIKSRGGSSSSGGSGGISVPSFNWKSKNSDIAAKYPSSKSTSVTNSTKSSSSGSSNGNNWWDKK